MRTGFGIASIAGSFKKMWIAGFGIAMIVGSLVQYALLNANLNSEKDPNNKALDLVPVIYIFLSLGALYLQWQK